MGTTSLILVLSIVTATERKRDFLQLKVLNPLNVSCSVLLLQTILAEYRIHNADIVLKYDATADDLIDVIEGNRVYIPCIYLLNKIGEDKDFALSQCITQYC